MDIDATIPKGVATLDQGGMTKLMELAAANPAVARAATEELRKDPHALITRVFKLTAAQASAIANEPPEDLLKRVAPVVEALEARYYEDWQLEFRKPPSGSASKGGLSCWCWIRVDIP